MGEAMTGYQSKKAAALDKLDDDDAQGYIAQYESALQKEYQRGYEAGKAAFAQPAQEPVAHPKPTQTQLAYLPPSPDFYASPQRTWVDLTEQQQSDIEDASEMMIGIVAFSLISDTLKANNT